ncbi:MAG: hypothetical protein E7670_06095 [Ruminococcaceae bacterium]|nr:hypothetical protein [Oscillospiraceae bacterium]
MSHRSEMETYAIEMAKRKKTVMTVIKVISALLAAALLATAVFVIVDIVNDNVSSSDEEGSKASYIQATQGKKVTVKQGSTVSYYSLVTVDEKYANYQLDVDTSKVDLNKPGSYIVTYKLLDSDGKTISTYKLTIVVEEIDEDKQALFALVKAKADSIGLSEEAVKSMTKEQIVRKIYDYVKDPDATPSEANIRFTDESNIPDINRDDWETDWVKEATMALMSANMQGDCYTYYSVSKAFFEYFEIENVGIRREVGSAISGTHFWNVVNIGTKDKPKWYYYDATRLAGKFALDNTNDACLITLAKLETYVTSKGEEGFYHFTPKNYPTAETTPLG